MKEGFKEAVGEEDGEVIGDRIGKMDTETASKFIETPNSNNGTNVVSGSASSGINVETKVATTGGASGGLGTLGKIGAVGAGIAISGGLSKTGGGKISTGAIKRANFLGGVGSGNFKLNQTFEAGLVGSIASSNKAGQNALAGTVANCIVGSPILLELISWDLVILE